jgi:hypothetical protein
MNAVVLLRADSFEAAMALRRFRLPGTRDGR